MLETLQINKLSKQMTIEQATSIQSNYFGNTIFFYDFLNNLFVELDSTKVKMLLFVIHHVSMFYYHHVMLPRMVKKKFCALARF
jgi:hypothetical protein